MNLMAQMVKSVILLISGVAIGFVALQIKTQIMNSFRSIEERNRVVNMFGQHVSPEVVHKLMEQKTETFSEMRYVCIMFLDIRNFTSFSESKTPEEVMDHLNYLFAFMIDIINRNNGIINKFLGDGFMAVFGAPLSDGEDCRNAVKAGMEILAQLQQEIDAERIVPTGIGIGLNAGRAVTGHVGSSSRKEYTIIGDVVNLASRIESLNKEFNSQFLVSEEVRQAIGEEGYTITSVGPAMVKGIEEPVPVFQLA